MEHSKNFNFWQMAYDLDWIGDTPEEKAEFLKGAVKTENNHFGEISSIEYKEITGIDFTKTAA